MINVDYLCRCGKKSRSLFDQKRHAKYMSPEKHIHREEFKTVLSLLEHRPKRPRKAKK